MENRETFTANVPKIQEAYRQLQSSVDAQSEHQSMALNRAILVMAAGSQAYGTYHPESDVDLRGVFIAPREYYYGLKTIEQVEFTRGNEKDTLFELRKFAKLAADANPNVVELMFLEPEHYLVNDWAGRLLLDIRHEFLSKRAAYSYSGYAFSQMKRIQNHYKWLTKPPTEPKKEDYTNIPRYQNVSTGKIIPETDFNAKMRRVDDLRAAAMGPQDDDDRSFFEAESNWKRILVLNKEAYEKHMAEWSQYNEWLKGRNKERRLLEAEYGYDTKHASQLVRLLVQCKQILTEGTLNTFLRPADRDLVMDVRYGKLSYPDLLKMALEINNEIEALKEKSSIPARANLKKINETLCEIVETKFASDYFDDIIKGMEGQKGH